MRRFALPIYALCAALFIALYFQPPISAPGASWEGLTTLQCRTPYQYRVLLPLLARGIHTLLPVPLMTAYSALIFGFVVVLFVAWREYLRPAFADSADAYALAMLYPLIWIYVLANGIRYPWDIPAMCFFVLGVVLISQAKWRLYYPMFVLACLNRETSCFLILAFALLTWRRQPAKWIALNVAAQSAIWLVNKAFWARVLAHNGGEKVFENKLASNADYFVRIVSHPLEHLDWILLTFGWMILLIPCCWRTQPSDFKRLLLIAPPFLFSMAIVGDYGQLRIHNELVPLLLAPALWSIEQGRSAVLNYRRR